MDKKLPIYFDGKWGKKSQFAAITGRFISVEREVAELTVDDES